MITSLVGELIPNLTQDQKRFIFKSIISLACGFIKNVEFNSRLRHFVKTPEIFRRQLCNTTYVRTSFKVFCYNVMSNKQTNHLDITDQDRELLLDIYKNNEFEHTVVLDKEVPNINVTITRLITKLRKTVKNHAYNMRFILESHTYVEECDLIAELNEKIMMIVYNKYPFIDINEDDLTYIIKASLKNYVVDKIRFYKRRMPSSDQVDTELEDEEYLDVSEVVQVNEIIENNKDRNDFTGDKRFKSKSNSNIVKILLGKYDAKYSRFLRKNFVIKRKQTNEDLPTSSVLFHLIDYLKVPIKSIISTIKDAGASLVRNTGNVYFSFRKCSLNQI